MAMPKVDRILGWVFGLLGLLLVAVFGYGAVSIFYDPRPATGEVRGMIFALCIFIVILAVPNCIGWLIVGSGRRLGYRFLVFGNGLLFALWVAGLFLGPILPLYVPAAFIATAIFSERRYRMLRQLSENR